LKIFFIESSSFLNENVNKEIIYREDLNINLVEDNNNNVNQHLNVKYFLLII